MGTGINITGLSLANDTLGPLPFSADCAARVAFGVITQRSTAFLPQSGTGTLFTVAGGRVRITSLIGEVTTVIQTQACTAKITSTPTVGAAVDLCATLDITAKVVGSLLYITGTLATALVNSQVALAMAQQLIVNTGKIDLITGGSNTGSVKWTIQWIPVDVGATLVAA